MKKFPLYFAIIFIIYLVITIVITSFLILPSYQKGNNVNDQFDDAFFITRNVILVTSASLIIAWIFALIIF